MKVGVFNTAFIGDVALMGKLIDALFHAGHEVVLYSNSVGCLLYEFDSRVARVVAVKKQRGLGKINSIRSIALQISEDSPDVLLLAHRSFTSGVIALLSGVRRVVAYEDAAFSQFLFEKVRCTQNQHESDRYVELARSLVSPESFDAAKLSLYGDSELSKFSRRFPEMLKSDRKFFICAPGSMWATKQYPVELCARVVERLLTALPQMQCVISGGPADREALEGFTNALAKLSPSAQLVSRLVDARDCLPISELIELTRRADFVLTPDSAPLHIASATGTRVFAFFGPTSAQTGFGPLNSDSLVLDYQNIRGVPLECQPCSKHGQRLCPLGHHKCLAELPPDAVAARMLQSLLPRG